MISRSELVQRDNNDELSSYRQHFQLPNDIIYLDGNSLGALPKVAAERVQQVTEQQWGKSLIGSWNEHDWVNLPQVVGDKIAPIIGADKGQVICCDSISVNLFKLLASAITLQQHSGKTDILSSQDNFPTDLYIAQGLSQLMGEQHVTFTDVAEQQLLDSIDDNTAVVMITEVNFRTGKLLDTQALAEKAHQHGALIIVDLAHSAGVIPSQLDNWQVDFAVGCTYKYLNGGPGAPAFVYVNKRWHGQLQQPISGWFGHRAPFDFSADYSPAADIKQFLAGTPAIISMAAVDSALTLYEDLDLQQVRTKSQQLTELFQQRVIERKLNHVLKLQSPEHSDQRGSQLSYANEFAYGLCQALIARGVIADFRAPNNIRFGFAPLYNRFVDVYDAVEQIEQMIERQEHLSEQWQQRSQVT